MYNYIKTLQVTIMDPGSLVYGRQNFNNSNLLSHLVAYSKLTKGDQVDMA
jgi:hypothetical protein